MNNEVQIAYFEKGATKSKVSKAVGDIVLDNICISCETDEDLSTGDYYLDATFIIDDDGIWQSIEEEGILKVKLDYGYEIFDIVKITKNTRDITVFARQHTIEKQLSTRLEDVRPENQNGYSALQWMLENSNEYKEGQNYARELEFSSDIEIINTAYYQEMNLYKALFDCDQSFINRWGGEIQRRGYRTTINKKIGQDRGFQVRYAKNLKGFEAETNIDSVYTRIKPKAYNGYTIEGYVQSGNIDKYATVRTTTIKYEDVKLQEDCEEDEVGYETLEELQAELIRLAELEFAENHIDEIQGTYTVSFEDLSKTEEYKNYSILERIYLGDTVNVFIDKLDVNISVRAIRKRYNVMTQKVIEIELSNLDLSEFKPKSFAEVVKEINKLPENFQNVLQQAREDATDLIHAGVGTGYFVWDENGWAIMDTKDKNTATNVWQFNLGGCGFSSTGYYGEYNTALTMDGKMVLNELTCEGINAMLIKAGILKSLNDKTWINMEDGSFNFADALKLVDGKLVLSHTNGSEGITIDKGGFKVTTYSSTNGMEEVAKLIATSFAKDRNQNGLSICTTGYGDYIQIGYERENGAIRAAMFFVPVGVPSTAGLPYTDAGIYIEDKTFVENLINFKYGLYLKSNGTKDHVIYNDSSNNYLNIFGDNGINLGFFNGDTPTNRLILHEAPPSGTGDLIESYGNWNFKGYTLHNLTLANYKLANTYANLETKSIAEVSALETNSTDNVRYVYKNITSKNNKIVLNIPSEYQGRNYDIIGVAKFGFGDYRITSKEENRFIIETDREMTMNIEISIN
ncbi:phage tail spike protein [Clostridium saudiense]|uniref:phage tail spike protein n=1 Tax=Clostridium saudiense TaxID=1414720 RepID=UPI002670BACD|nr:phage tail spike protein [Clostridium saudiense]